MTADMLVGLLVWVFVLLPLGLGIVWALVALIVGVVNAVFGGNRAQRSPRYVSSQYREDGR